MTVDVVDADEINDFEIEINELPAEVHEHEYEEDTNIEPYKYAIFEGEHSDAGVEKIDSSRTNPEAEVEITETDEITETPRSSGSLTGFVDKTISKVDESKGYTDEENEYTTIITETPTE